MTIFDGILAGHLEAIQSLRRLSGALERLADDVSQSLEHGGKLLLFGNGGSAGDAQHVAAEFTGRFVRERRGLPAIALTTDTSALTAIANDYGYDRVFARQVEALVRPGDVVLGISTSGNSSNVLSALETALAMEAIAWGFSGRDGGRMNELLGPRNLVVAHAETARVQECHIVLGHALCELVDRRFAAVED